MSTNERAGYAEHQTASGGLAGRRIAVTGGTSGLGLALVEELSTLGAHVAFVARGRERIEQVRRKWPKTHGIAGDVARKDEIHPIAIQVASALGGVDVLINNASSLGPVPLASLADTDCEDLEQALATNLLGPFRLTKALLGSLASSAREGRGARGRQHLQRRRRQRVRRMGRLRREQSSAAAHDAHLAGGARSSRRAADLVRPGRHGHSAARRSDPRCGPLHSERPRQRQPAS